jgi:hypothetical protein
VLDSGTGGGGVGEAVTVAVGEAVTVAVGEAVTVAVGEAVNVAVGEAVNVTVGEAVADALSIKNVTANVDIISIAINRINIIFLIINVSFLCAF